ncbi:MAG: AI-2E family transporter [Planctomycetes bacterium]|nr:AI-2E family transporter [Planctomycetota bacterium]
MNTENTTPEHHPHQGPGSSGTKAIALSVSVLVFLGLCYFIKGTLTSLLLAFMLAYIFNPAVDFIESRRKPFPRLRVPRAGAIAIILTLVLFIGLGFLALTIPKTVSGARHVARTAKQHYPRYQKQLIEYLGEYGKYFPIDALKEEAEKKAPPGTEEGVEPIDLVVQFKEYIPVAVRYTFNTIKKLFYSTLGLMGTVADVLIFAFVSVYLLKDYHRIIKELKALIPPSRRDKVLELMAGVDNALRGFLRGQLTVSMILGLYYSIGLTILGVPMSFLVGFVGGIGNMVPYLGTLTGVTLAMILTALEHPEDVWRFAVVGVIFAGGQAMEILLLTPRIVGRSVGLPPVVIILSALVWGQLLGLLGLLIAIPATSAAVVFGAEAVRQYKEYITEIRG